MIQAMDHTFVLLEYKETDLSIGENKMWTWILHKWGKNIEIGFGMF